MSTATDLPPPGYEPRDASPRAIALVGAAIVLCVALVLVAVAWICRTEDQHQPPPSVDPLTMSFRHGPDEQTSIARDWSHLDESVHAHLRAYGWIDRKNGVVRIPIERAMELIASEPGALPKENSRR